MVDDFHENNFDAGGGGGGVGVCGGRGGVPQSDLGP